jgi:hypothetical protein
MNKPETFHIPQPDNGLVHGAGGRSDLRGRVRAVLREPLFHFVLFGLLIFAAAHWQEARSQRYRIAITPDALARLVNSYALQYGALPQPEQVHSLVDNYIREEIYLREGLALGLDRNDEIVRRRIAQKFDFLQQDMAVLREPSEAVLRTWFDAHRAQFVQPARRSFEQQYFAADERGDAAARALAEDAERRLATGQTAPAGDEFPGPKTISRLSRDDIERLFGGADFARAVIAAPAGHWVGPYRSGFGWHVLRVTEEVPSRARSFEEARAEARLAWQQADRAARNRQAYDRLVARYTIERADR